MNWWGACPLITLINTDGRVKQLTAMTSFVLPLTVIAMVVAMVRSTGKT